MEFNERCVDIPVDSQALAGTLISPGTKLPGILLIHGWGGNQEQYVSRAKAITALGCVCLTFDLRGHERHAAQKEIITRKESMEDVVAAYDFLVSQRSVDEAAIAVIGSSYGGYLACLLSTLRKVKWLGLRAPALYRDDDWHVPKQQLHKRGLGKFRQSSISAEENTALKACGAFEGDVLIVESENDVIVPHMVIANYMASFQAARSVTYRVIDKADHGLSSEAFQLSYTSLLVNWASEMITGARKDPSSTLQLVR